MAGYTLLGVYDEVDQVAEAVGQVRQLGVPENRISVLSATPLSPLVLGRPRPRSRVAWFSLIGAIAGALGALTLVGGTQLLYPIRQGGQPLWPIPPQLIILFEVTMLGTMWATFIGFVLTNRLPRYGRPVNDPRIMAGRVGLVVEADDQRADRAMTALRNAGAIDVIREPWREQVDNNKWLLWLWTVLLILGVAGLAGGLVAYDYLRIPWITQMANQISVAYEQGPRKAPPADAVLTTGPVFVGEQPGTQPVKADQASLQRGQILYNMHCALCHNTTGEGNGPISGYWNPKPRNLSDPAVQTGMDDNHIFTVISHGYGIMPSIREDLVVTERWDVVNWVRTLKK